SLHDALPIYRRRGGPLDEEDLVPVDAEVGDDAHLAGGGEELARQVDGDGLGLAGGDAHVLDDGAPLPGGVLDLELGHEEAAPGPLGGAEEGAAVGPVDPAGEDEDGAAVGSDVCRVAE